MTVHILANGTSERFGSQKHLVTTFGEPLIERTLRMLNTRKTENVIIYTRDTAIAKCAEDYYYVLVDMSASGRGTLHDMSYVFRQSVPGMNCLLYGDVVWSRWALDFVLRQEGVKNVGHSVNHNGEGYAYTWPESARDKLLALIDVALNDCEEYRTRITSPISGDGGWQFCRRLMGVKPFEKEYNYKVFYDLKEIGDWTMDIDFLSDYDYFKKEIEPLYTSERAGQHD